MDIFVYIIDIFINIYTYIIYIYYTYIIYIYYIYIYIYIHIYIYTYIIFYTQQTWSLQTKLMQQDFSLHSSLVADWLCGTLDEMMLFLNIPFEQCHCMLDFDLLINHPFYLKFIISMFVFRNNPSMKTVSPVTSQVYQVLGHCLPDLEFLSVDY